MANRTTGGNIRMTPELSGGGQENGLGLGTGGGGAPEVYAGVGAMLRQARLAAGMEISDVANRLRIKDRQILAIEDGAFERIPGHIYAMGFIRNYAELLGLDGRDAVERFKAETGHAGGTGRLEFPTPNPENRMPRTGLVLLAIVIAALAYAGWYFLNDIQRFATDLVSEVPDRMQPVGNESQPAPESAAPAETTETATATTAAGTAADKVPEPVPEPAAKPAAKPATESTAAQSTGETAQPATAETQTGETQTGETQTGETLAAKTPAAEPQAPETQSPEPQATKTPATEPRPSDRIAELVPAAPVAAVDTAPLPSPPAEETPTAAPPEPAPKVAAALPPAVPQGGGASAGYVPQVFGTSNTDARVVLRARYDSWVQVRGANGELLLTRVLRPGDSYLVPNRSDLRLFASDAGALEVIVDGKPLPAIGAAGEVVRGVDLGATALLTGAARQGG